MPQLSQRRPSRLNGQFERQSLSVDSSEGQSSSALGKVSYRRSDASVYPFSATPLHLRLLPPAFFRHRSPIVVFLVVSSALYLLFAPARSLASDRQQIPIIPFSPAYHHPKQAQEAIAAASASASAAQQEAQSWRDRFFERAAGRFAKSAKAIKADDHYTEADGLLFFPPAPATNAQGGVALARAGQPDVRHPILHLVEQAEKKWEALLEKQSTTLEAAVKEYTRRYNRPPPAGFDLWWDFAQKHNVQLVDEYDSIMRDIEPFFALPPSVFEARSKHVSYDPDFFRRDVSFTFVIDKGTLSLIGPAREHERAPEFIKLLEPFVQYLPDLK